MSINNVGRIRSSFLSLATILFCGTAGAQDYQAVIAQYKNEMAVIASHKEQLMLRVNDGKLEANSYVTKEKILISDQSPALFNSEYIFHGYFDKLVDYEAVALVPGKKGYKKMDDAVIKTTSDEQRNVFSDDSKQTEVSFTGLTPGSVIRVNYTLNHNDIHILPGYFFEGTLRTAVSTFEVTVPKYVHMRFVIKGADTGRVSRKTEENKGNITYTFTASNVAQYKSYDDEPSGAWHALQVIPFIASYQLPGKERVDLLSDPEHLYRYLYTFIKDVNTKESEELTRKVKELTAGDKTADDKAAHIYQWVQQNIYYIAFEDSLEGFIPRQAADIYKRKFGDCKDMASILVAMCRAAEIPAYFTWIGTRRKPYTYTETPLPLVSNHMICAIKTGNEWKFMDGTDPQIPFGEIPYNLQDKEALIGIDSTQFAIVRIPESKMAANGCTDSTIITLDDRSINGKSILDLRGHRSWDMQNILMYSKNKDRSEFMRRYLLRGSNKFVLNNYDFLKAESGSKPFRLVADFTVGEYVQKVAKEIFVNMNLMRYLEDARIDSARGSVPVYYNYAGVQKEVVVLQVPTGYHVTYLPEAASGSLGDRWDYTISYKSAGDKVILTKEYRFNCMTIQPADFKAHNKMIDELKKQYKETIVLNANQ